MKYLFVVTHGRSGSTALMKALNAIPGYCIRGENAGILRPMVETLEVARANAKWHTTDYTPSDPWYGANLGNPDRLQGRLARGLIEDVICPPEGTRVAGFKEIRYMLQEVEDRIYWPMMQFLLFGIGEARIILLTRDPATTARSGWFRKAPFEQTRDHIAATHQRFRKTAGNFPKRSFLLDHSVFADDPNGLRPLLEWLEEDFDPQALRAALSERLMHAHEPRD